MDQSDPGRAAVRTKPRKDPTIPATVAVGSAILWWIALLATIPLGFWSGPADEGLADLFSTVLILLPWVAAITGIVAIRRSKPQPAVPARDRRTARGRLLGWIGVLLGAVAPFFVVASALDSGL